MGQAEGNVGLAFGLVIAAGLSTTVGACFVFCTSLASKRFLAASLGASAGVMLYVSFAEIFCLKAVDAFEEAGSDNPEAKRWATLSFFGGVIVTVLLDLLVHSISNCIKQKNPNFVPAPEHAHDFAMDQPLRDNPGDHAQEHDHRDQTRGPGTTTSAPPVCVCHVDLTAITQPSKPRGGDELEEEPKTMEDGYATKKATSSRGGSSDTDLVVVSEEDSDEKYVRSASQESVVAAIPAGSASMTVDGVAVDMPGDAATSDAPGKGEYEGLGKMGTMTAIAIALHNFPEGLATFVATLADESLGVAIAIAIGLHNIPEGACVAVPVYFATGSRLKGFMWAFLSGLTEIFGAIVGYAILGDGLDKNAEGTLFGLVAGMMVYISLAELLPTAFKYDERGWLATGALFVGMAVMALSLLAFEI